MILGIGTDLCDIRRIEKIRTRHQSSFDNKILTQREREELIHRSDKNAYVAKRFAAKEAAAKALGTGIGRGISWQQMHIEHDELGVPLLILQGAAKQRQTDLGSHKTHISIADELDQALAFVVLS